MPVCRVSNIAQTVDELKKKNIWVYAAEADGTDFRKTDLTGGIALIFGSEGDGVSRLVREKCDGVVSIPMYGEINSLNISAAAAVIMFGASSQRFQQTGALRCGNYNSIPEFYIWRNKSRLSASCLKKQT